MGLTDKLKNISNWESAVVVTVFLLVCGSIIVVGSQVQDVTLATTMIVGGLVALGIPTSFMGNIGQKVATAAVNNPTSKEQISKKDLDDLRICIADTRNEVLLLKTKVGD